MQKIIINQARGFIKTYSQITRTQEKLIQTNYNKIIYNFTDENKPRDLADKLKDKKEQAMETKIHAPNQQQKKAAENMGLKMLVACVIGVGAGQFMKSEIKKSQNEHVIKIQKQEEEVSELIQQEKYSEAESYCNQIIQDKYNKQNSQQVELERIYTLKGNCVYKLGRFGDAIEIYEEAIKINKNCYEAYYQKGYILHQLKKFQEAISLYEQCLKTFEQNQEQQQDNNQNIKFIKQSLGSAYYENKQYDKAEQLFDQILVMDANFVEAYDGKGKIYFKQKQFPEAIDCFKKALEIDPNYTQAANNLKFVQEKVNSLLKK